MKIFLDSSDLNQIKAWKDRVDGFTTNPSLMKKAGVTDYEKFCKEVLELIPDKPVSFEVFADEFDEMERQASIISSWGKNVYVKIPITNTKGESSLLFIQKLTKEIQLNITAITDVSSFTTFLISPHLPMIFSYFAGRVADTGRNPIGALSYLKRIIDEKIEILWASTREVLNIYQAEQGGCDIITCTPELLEKYHKFKDMDLDKLSLMTVKQFYEDAQAAGYTL